MVSDTGNVNKNSQDQLEQNERNGYFYLEVQEEPFGQGLLFTPREIVALSYLLGILEE